MKALQGKMDHWCTSPCAATGDRTVPRATIIIQALFPLLWTSSLLLASLLSSGGLAGVTEDSSLISCHLCSSDVPFSAPCRAACRTPCCAPVQHFNCSVFELYSARLDRTHKAGTCFALKSVETVNSCSQLKVDNRSLCLCFIFGSCL